DGAEIVAIGYLRNDTAAEEAAEELRELGAEPVLVRGNVASARVAGEIAALGEFDAVVHAAATGVIRPALETTDKHFDWTLAANARAFLSIARAAVPQMSNGSSLVAISSLGSVRVLENYTLVGTSKAALESLVRDLAVELAPELVELGALVTGIDPSEAKLAAARLRAPDAAFFQAELDEIPLQFRRNRFTLVYASEGTLAQVRELGPFASALTAALRKNGRLILYDAHPVFLCIDPVDLRWRGSYFAEGLWRLGQIAVAFGSSL